VVLQQRILRTANQIDI